VLVDRDHHRDRRPLFHLLGLRVELLAELLDVQAALAERRTDRRRGISAPRRHLQFDVSSDFFCHLLLLWWCGSRRLATPPSPPTGSHFVMAGLGPATSPIASRLAQTPVRPASRARRSTPPPSRASGPRQPLPPCR